MTDPQPDLYETVLRQCAAARPEPWYPRPFAEARGIPRAELDVALERLRLRGLVHLTEWTQGQGQGYALTPDGERVLQNAGLLGQVRAGRVPAARPPRPDWPRGGRRVTPYERGEIIRDALTNPSPPLVTFTLIFLNVLVFLLGLALALQQGVPLNEYLASSDTTILHQTGSVSFLDIIRGDWWRLLTSCFVHIGALHIGVNMYALYNLGQLMERLLGRWRYLVLYLVAGFGGSCVGVIGGYGCAGASGAICGLLGALLSWTLLNREYLPPPIFASIQRYVVVNGILIAIISFVPGISWAGHLGGAVYGAVAGGLLNTERFGGGLVRVLMLLGVLALPVTGVAALLRAEATGGGPVEHVKKVLINEQRREILDEVAPPFRKLVKKARDLDAEAVEPVLDRHPTRRDPVAVEKALTTLVEARAKVAEAANVLTSRGRYTDSQALEAQRLGKEYATELGKLLELQDQCLREGPDWKGERELRRQRLRVEEARQEFDQFVPRN